MSMNEKELLKLLSAHEWKDIEFKEARRAVSKNVYESVSVVACACKYKKLSIYDIRDVLGRSLQNCRDIAGHLVIQVLFVKMDNDFYELSPVMQERFKHVKSEAHDGLTETERQILNYCVESKSTPELLGYSSRTGNYKSALSNLLSGGYLEMTIPDSPRSKNQRYKSTLEGRLLVHND